MEDLWILLVTILVAIAGGYYIGQAAGNNRQKQPVHVLVQPREEPPDTPVFHPATSETAMAAFQAASRVPKHVTSRLIIVAYFLPVTVSKNAAGKWVVVWDDARSFLANLRCLSSRLELAYVGQVKSASPIEVSDQEAVQEVLSEHNCEAVFLPAKQRDEHFRFCKEILWPLFHYVLPTASASFGRKWKELWQPYSAVNMIFANKVAEVAQSTTDSIWIQHFHLLLTPSFIRKKLPRAKIALFIHTPWPAAEVIRVLPRRENILRGIMCADMVGFHTYDYARHFLTACKRILHLDFAVRVGGSFGVNYSGRTVALRISHVGIEGAFFQEMAHGQTVQEKVDVIRKRHHGRQILLGMDDFDGVKGSLLKLQAYELFLEDHPEWKDRVCMLEVFMPSKTIGQDSSGVRASIESQIEAIRTKYGDQVIETIEMTQGLSMQDLVSFYSAADVAVVSTFWDGLNLLPFEFTASQPSNKVPGMLVLSEFMGCSRSLSGVIRVNPWALDDVVAAMHTALEMTPAKRQAEHARRQAYVFFHDTFHWGMGFVDELDLVTENAEDVALLSVGWGSNAQLVALHRGFSHINDTNVVPAFRKAPHRVLLLHLDGALLEGTKVLEEIDETNPDIAALVVALQALSNDPKAVVIIMSQRSRYELQRCFAKLLDRVVLIAEHGCFLRWPDHLAHMRHKKFSIPDQPVPLKSSTLRTSSRYASSASLRSDNTAAAADTTCSYLREDYPSDDEDTWTWEELRMGTQSDLVAVDIAAACQIMASYTDHTDGAFRTQQEKSIRWNYADADPEFGNMQATELVKHLKRLVCDAQLPQAAALEVSSSAAKANNRAKQQQAQQEQTDYVTVGGLSTDVMFDEETRVVEVRPHGVNISTISTYLLNALMRKHFTRSPSTSSSSSPAASSNNSPSASPLLSSAAPAPKWADLPFVFVLGAHQSHEPMFAAVHDFENRITLNSPSMDPASFEVEETPQNAQKTSFLNEKHGGLKSKHQAVVNKEHRKTFTAIVGMTTTLAKHFLYEHSEVKDILQAFAVVSKNEARMKQTAEKEAADNVLPQSVAGAKKDVKGATKDNELLRSGNLKSSLPSMWK